MKLVSDRPTSVRRLVVPRPSFAELLLRLSRGRLGPEVAEDLLRIEAKRVVLTVEIDRETGLVKHWRFQTHGQDQESTAHPTSHGIS
jgi:hypothetical protein